MDDTRGGGVEKSTSYGEIWVRTSSETSQVYSSTQGRVSMFTHPVCLLGAHDLLGLLFCEQLSAATRAHARHILLVRSSGAMWSRWGRRNIYEIVEIKGVRPRSGRCRMVSLVLRLW